MACILYFEFKPWWTIISIGRKYMGKSVLHIEFVVVTQVKNIDHKCVYQILSNHFGIQGENYFGGFWSSSTSDQSFWDASKICSIYFAHLWRFDAISLTHFKICCRSFSFSHSLPSQLQRPTLFTSLRSFPVFICILLVNNHCTEQKFFASPEKFHVLCF